MEEAAVSHLALGTRLQYDKLIRLYLGSLLDCTIHEMTPQRVDLWLDYLKNPEGPAMKRVSRHSFEHELTLLTTILRYYQEYHDEDTVFRFPIKDRHREMVQLSRERKEGSKDLTEEEFSRFREKLFGHKYGPLLAVLATVQYYQALRISEVAGLFWEDLQFDWTVPQNSRVRIVRLVFFTHKQSVPSFLRMGFKNADANEGMKEQPMFPETFEALRSLYREGVQGLVFQLEGEHLPYRVLQSHFDRAFKQAGLSYRGTHVMRHGGCRRVFNHAPDTAVAQQLLGNSDLKTTLVYAKRHASALTTVAHGYWKQASTEIGCNGCNRLKERKSESEIS